MSAYLCTQIDAYMYLQLNDLWTLYMCVCLCVCVRMWGSLIYTYGSRSCHRIVWPSAWRQLLWVCHPPPMPLICTITHWHTYNTHSHTHAYTDMHTHSRTHSQRATKLKQILSFHINGRHLCSKWHSKTFIAPHTRAQHTHTHTHIQCTHMSVRLMCDQPRESPNHPINMPPTHHTRRRRRRDVARARAGLQPLPALASAIIQRTHVVHVCVCHVCVCACGCSFGM